MHRPRCRRPGSRCAPPSPAPPRRPGAAAEGATALLVGDSPVTADVLGRSRELRIVATVTAGTDQVDLAAARELGIWVANVPDAYTEEVAVHALAMMLSLMRQLPRYDRHVRAGGWDPLEGPRPSRPSELTLGIVGLGRIGSRLAAIARPLFGRAARQRPGPGRRPRASSLVGLERLLAESDVVSLHLPITPQTQRPDRPARARRMRPGALLVNVARGGLVDQAALLDALDSGRLAGAGARRARPRSRLPETPLLRHPRRAAEPARGLPFGSLRTRRHARQAENVGRLGAHRPAAAVVVEGRP